MATIKLAVRNNADTNTIGTPLSISDAAQAALGEMFPGATAAEAVNAWLADIASTYRLKYRVFKHTQAEGAAEAARQAELAAAAAAADTAFTGV